MEQPKSKRGGSRPGSGRKALTDGERLEPVSIKMSQAQKAKLQQLGGAPWVRDKIDKAKVLASKE